VNLGAKKGSFLMSSVLDFPIRKMAPATGLVRGAGGAELVVRIYFGFEVAYLHVTHGPAFDGASIHAWVDGGIPCAADSTLTIDVSLDRCAVIRDGLHRDPCARLGDVRFSVMEEDALLLEKHYAFVCEVADE
jgi:hypothetical protein